MAVSRRCGCGLLRLAFAAASVGPRLAGAQAAAGIPPCVGMPNYSSARGWCGDQSEPFACYKDADSENPTWDCRISNPGFCGGRACRWKTPGSTDGAALTPSCDERNVGFPNCPEGARCAGEYSGGGDSWVLRATSTTCAYVTFRTPHSLRDLLQIDANVHIAPGTCQELDNLAFWFFQTAEVHAGEPQLSWDALSEVDMMETYIGPGAVNSVNTNFAATGIPMQWPDVTITGGVRKHVTFWQDTENAAGCPATRMIEGTNELLPVASVYVAHCDWGSPTCCGEEGCASLRYRPGTARACITVKEAPVLLVLSNWGANHWVTPGCEIGAANIVIQTT